MSVDYTRTAGTLKTGDVVNDDQQYGTITVNQVRFSGPYVRFTGKLSGTDVSVRRVWRRTDRITIQNEKENAQ